MARTAARAAQTAADAAAAAAGAGRVDLYRDTATYRHTRASTIFRNIILSRPPARGRGLELVIASSSRTWTAPFYCGTTDDWIDLTLLTSSQVTARVSGAAASIQNTIPLKSISFGEDDTDAFGHGIVYVGRISDNRMGIAFSQNRGVEERFRMTVREIP